MKIWTSYFYQIRFFKPYQIPLSTADWDPKWFHDFKDQDYIWKDKNGVWNGLRIDTLSPSKCCSILPPECVGCSSLESRHPDTCSFLKDYSGGLHSRVDFGRLLDLLQRIATGIQQSEGFSEEPEIMLILHEAPNNPCSERVPIQEYFKEHGIEVKEWEK
jgi:hypothetical protein